MALPFLPTGQIQSAFDTLAARATSPELQQLVTYMKNTWITNSVWQPRNWCVFQISINSCHFPENSLTKVESTPLNTSGRELGAHGLPYA
jgi:hypothetical protein